MSYENVWEEKGVYRKYSGIVSGKEIRNAVEEVEGDVRFDSIRYVVNDFLDVTKQTISPRDIEILAAIDKAASLSNPDIRIAIVATEQGIQDLVSRYCELSDGSPYESKMFLNVDDAREWLGYF